MGLITPALPFVLGGSKEWRDEERKGCCLLRAAGSFPRRSESERIAIRIGEAVPTRTMDDL